MEQEKQNTRAFVIAYDGKIIGERYALGWTKDTLAVQSNRGVSRRVRRPSDIGSRRAGGQ